jgi:hypothetical protein
MQTLSKHHVADPLQDGELGFIVPAPNGFLIVPCPWGELSGIGTGPHRTEAGAMAAVRAYLARRFPPGR